MGVRQRRVLLGHAGWRAWEGLPLNLNIRWDKRTKLIVAAALLLLAGIIAIWQWARIEGAHVGDDVLNRAEQIRSQTNDFAPPESTLIPEPPPPPPGTEKGASRRPRTVDGG